MTQQVGSLHVKLGADIADLKNKLNQAKSEMRATSNEVDKQSSVMSASFAKIGAAAAAAFAGFSAIQLGKQITQLAIDAVESQNLFTVSMGKMADASEQWAKQVSGDLGLYETEVKRFLGTFNVMLTSMEVAPEKAYDMSRSLTQLAYDMSSFYNIGMEEAFQKLQSGISGEIEPLKRLGIIVNETITKQTALKYGIAQVGEEMTEAQKVQARYLAIMERTSAAQGDLARTADSPANKLRILESQAKQLGESLGQLLVPALSETVGWLTQLTSGLNDAVSGLQKYQTATIKAQELMKTGSGFFGVGNRGQAALLGQVLAGDYRDADAAAAAYDATLVRIAEHQRKLDDALAVFATTVEDVINQANTYNATLSTTSPKLEDMIDQVARVSGGLVNMANSSSLARAFLVNIVPGPLQIVAAAADNAAAAFGRMAAAAYQAFVMATNAMLAQPSIQGIGAIGGAIKGMAGLGNVAGSLLNLNRVLNPPTPAPVFSGISSGASSAADAVDDLAQSIIDAMGGMSTLVSGMVAMNPAALAAASAVNNIKLALVGANDQLDALRASMSQVSRQLSDAQQKLNEFMNPRLEGQGAMDEKQRAIELQIKRIQYARKMGLSMAEVKAMFPMLTEGMEEYVGGLPTSVSALQRMLDKLNLEESLTYDEKLAKIREAAQGAQQELSFEEALAGASHYREEVTNLTAQLRSMEEASIALQASIAEMQKSLAEQEARQRAVNEALQIAYKWYLEDRPKVLALGEAGAEVAATMDVKVGELLANIGLAATDTSSTASKTLADMVINYNRDVALALLKIGEIQAALASIPTEITTIHTTIHKDEYSGVVPEPRAVGGSVIGGQPYLVGEFGPELFVPHTSGSIEAAPVGGNVDNRVIIYATVANDIDLNTLAYKVARYQQTRRVR